MRIYLTQTPTAAITYGNVEEILPIFCPKLVCGLLG
jgi:hypothetical protein